MVPMLAQYWSADYSRYVEPFAGSARLFFHLAPKRALLGDINAELMGTYSQIRKNCRRVYNVLKALKPGRRAYQVVRSMDPSLLPGTTRAARFIYLNHLCFNGLYRTNRDGQFNVPYGGDKTGPLPAFPMLDRYASLLQRATLLAGDFERVLQRVKRGDFVYLDPPFSLRRRRMFHQYDATAFGWADLQRLRSWMEKLNDMDVPFLVSFAESDEGRELCRGFKTRRVLVRRSIGGFMTSRTRVTELLISNRKPIRRTSGTSRQGT